MDIVHLISQLFKKSIFYPKADGYENLQKRMGYLEERENV